LPAETALYPPVKAFLERQGFTVKGEIRGCDIVALRDGEPPLVVVGELKLGLSLELILQAVARLAVADEVYPAVPLTRRGRDQDARAHKLCRRLGLGLLTVNLGTGHVAVICEPEPYRPRINLRRRGLMLREFQRRQGDPMAGGAAMRQPLMTAYRQQALACAARLHLGPARPRDLRPAAPDAAAILARNPYGWFIRLSRGVYGLTPAGETAARGWLAQQTPDPLASTEFPGGPPDAPCADRRDCP
jgi:hypothetical protein